MCRNIFLTLSVVGCGVLFPVYLVGGKSQYNQWKGIAGLMKLTPQYIFGNIFWVLVAIAWAFDIIICGFIWWNYRAVLRLRRDYLNSPEYQSSLHARTMMVRSLELL